MAVSLRISLLGPFDVAVNGRTLGRAHSRKENWLLALLVLRNGKEVSRDWLAGTLWPDTPESQALSYVRQNVYLVKRALEGEAGRVQSSTSRTLRLDLSGAEVDVTAFDLAIQGGGLAALEQAVSLYRGPLLEGCDEEWIQSERQAREQAYLQCLETLAEDALERGEPSAALPHLRRLVQKDPLRESAHRSLMQALSDDGSLGAMSRAYRDLRLTLHQEVHSEPDPQTVALFDRLRSAAPGRCASQGRRAVADESREKAPPATPATEPPAASAIPSPITALVGREDLVRDVVGSLSRARLLTLTGTGGVGKTRVAIDASRSYPGSVWFVELAPALGPANVPLAAAKALGIAEQQGIAPEETIARRLAAVSGLLVLDNCEHLLESCARLCSHLLRSCPNLRILTTSRQILGIAGEAAMPVPALETPPPPEHAPGIPAWLGDSFVKRGSSPAPAVPPAYSAQSKTTEPGRSTGLVGAGANGSPASESNLAEILLEFDSIRLFVERARAVNAGFALTNENGPIIAQICRRLDGIPLAIELTAARANVLSPRDILARLDDRFSLLTRGNRHATEHHRTLRASVDWSYNLLSPEEQALLSRLSVFSGGWTLERAGRVAAKDPLPDLVDLLSSLVDKSLVAAVHSESEIRYSLLETIRDFAAQKLRASGEWKAVHERHYACFLDLMVGLKPALTGPGHREAVRTLEQEHDNLRSALRWSVEEAGDPAKALLLSAETGNFWLPRGYFSEARAWLGRALQRVGKEDRTEPRAYALQQAGVMAFVQGDLSEACSLLEEAVSIRREIGVPLKTANALLCLGLATRVSGDLVRAARCVEASLEIYRQAGDRTDTANALNNLGLVYHQQNDLAKPPHAWRRA